MTDGDPVDTFEGDGGPTTCVLALSTRAEEVLNAHPRTRGLVASLPHADTSPLRIALLGPYSAGKSMLIAALRRLPSADVEELVDAAPKTHEATPHPWNGVTLVDLPGTLSGNDKHSDAARRGVRGADALMIVTTSELPGEAETRAILQALDGDGFADRSVVVVNKMNAENSDRDVILDEIRKRLGPFADRVPIVPTDARDYVDAVNDPELTAAHSELLVTESGVDALTAELRRIIAPGVGGVRPKAQAFELLRVLADAERKWVLDGEELSAAETAKKVEETISRAKESVLSTLARESEVVASKIRTAGARTAASVSEKDGVVPVDVARAVSEELVRASTDFDAKFSSSVRTAFDALVAEYGIGVPEPEAWVNDLDSPEARLDASPDDASPFERAVREAAEKAAKAGARKMHEWIGKVAASGSESGNAASDIAAWLNKRRVGQKVLDTGEKITNGVGKFKPWGKGKAANKVASTASKVQWVMAAMGPLMDLKSVAQDQGKWMTINKRRKMIRDHFDEEALRQRTGLTDAGKQHLREWIAEVEQSLSGLTNQGAEISAARETALEGIKSLRDEAEKLVRSAAD
ncbi:GTPase [Streptomyces sp. NBC_00140]|uniref:GTPase n=1 Tax=Streptomyces sp. NBC_00140 TaxID=2975664 RepID=UPI00225A9716|nr:GTPase [Streptomyces sp. NBC_00140]MCX5334561.1 50S ribosome-binding GTPase [Streptomyces sp. NBC_00140]